MIEQTDLLQSTDEEIQFEDTVSEETETIPQDGTRSIVTKAGDPEIVSLYNKWKDGELILQPDFQRQFVWDKPKSSRLIESALLDVPLPIIYLAEDDDGSESVIDGQQRLTAFFSFIDGKFPDGESFRLSGLKVLDDLNRQSFGDLDKKLQKKIKCYQPRVITILSNSHKDLRFEIFERLNTGSVPLNDMELRNCVYRGNYITILKELAADPEFKQLLGLKSTDKRMRDVELVLRFAAFYHASYLKYQSPMKKFFNNDMEKHKNIDPSDADDLRRAFKNSIAIIKSLFPDNAFKRFSRGHAGMPDGCWETKRFNASLYDVFMGVFADKDKNQVYAALDSLREALVDLMATNDEFIDAILLGTSDREKVIRRFDIVRKTVDDVLKQYPKQPRCFSAELKKELYQKDATCAICNQQIQSLDDAAVDHIKQYWQGGQTIPENARLTHRFCNWSRSRND